MSLTLSRQPLYACTTCSQPSNPSFKPAGVCLACSYHCHEGHTLVDLKLSIMASSKHCRLSFTQSVTSAVIADPDLDKPVSSFLQRRRMSRMPTTRTFLAFTASAAALTQTQMTLSKTAWFRSVSLSAK